ncbi:MAG: prephenate dehydrogenase/arogenate dehydrogenase family protein [Acidobacteriaceae bacterium]|nr:prephenate dehydrogenase/arogenate dehydrogenase family protein [Acidobacteriaceae bacterium]
MFRRIAIAGLGLIGGSMALAARRLWPEAAIIGVDRPEVLDRARDLGAVTGVAESIAGVGDADLIVLAAPVQRNIELLDAVAASVRHPAIVTDTGSTKRDIVAAAEARMPAHLTFVGGHPLGGAATSGIDYARVDLFAGRPWLFTPSQPPNPEAEQTLFAFAEALGASPRRIDADAHDRLLAFVSHLPQLTASALMQVVGRAVGEENLAIAGRGLVDTTRLASSASSLWREIVSSNADEIGPALDALIDTLQHVRADLTRGDALVQLFDEASRWRDALVTRTPI